MYRPVDVSQAGKPFLQWHLSNRFLLPADCLFPEGRFEAPFPLQRYQPVEDGLKVFFPARLSLEGFQKTRLLLCGEMAVQAGLTIELEILGKAGTRAWAASRAVAGGVCWRGAHQGFPK